MGGLSASDAFWAHLRTLCLDEFPCGAGSWNKSRFPQQKAKPRCRSGLQRASAVLHEELIPPTEETAETLTEFLKSLRSPWALPPDCSPEDQQLRELAVQDPQVIQDSFIFSYFKSLRIVNKGVTEIDADLLRFPNLEELILSANHICKINSANLPPTLKVLELCGNEVDSLKDLCASPPPELQHLGLGHNCHLGSSQEDFLTDAFWPNLVSLDLSYNNFTDLLCLLSKLWTLKKLRVLVLQGNPLALMPGYRGFTLDSLPKLCALDDGNITPDERHWFLGLSGNPELLQQEVEMVVTVGKIQGVPNPVISEELESSLESSVVTYNYYVTYEFAKGEEIDDGDNTKIPVSQNPTSTTLNAQIPPAGPDEAGSNEVAPLGVPDKLELPSETANVHSTLRKPWAETIECEYRKEHITKDLVALKSYLLAGTTVAIVEEKIVSWPVIVSPVETPSKKGKGKVEKGKPEKGGKDKGKEEKGKGEKGKPKDGGKGSGKKKKKSPSPELRSDPPILKILGSGHVNLESLLAGESLVATVCDFGVLITELRPQLSAVKEKDGKKGKNKDKKNKSGPESAATQKTTPPAKGNGRKQDSPRMTEVQITQPVPLTVEFQIQHLKWKSASEILIKPKVST
ncbi:leucine-rich repeat-containing protein 43 [Eublepharis macularius]|uniref:Leucine-rich repeat-containing protein 43 n=1 Tax=Eublepharis macularius TaxID=481883 RepID=A0AA97LF65_EUBMA|nr:leucine-rich repeat-containing protein 43 [Eublepharis macularius]